MQYGGVECQFYLPVSLNQSLLPSCHPFQCHWLSLFSLPVLKFRFHACAIRRRWESVLPSPFPPWHHFFVPRSCNTAALRVSFTFPYSLPVITSRFHACAIRRCWESVLPSLFPPCHNFQVPRLCNTAALRVSFTFPSRIFRTSAPITIYLAVPGLNPITPSLATSSTISSTLIAWER